MSCERGRWGLGIVWLIFVRNQEKLARERPDESDQVRHSARRGRGAARGRIVHLRSTGLELELVFLAPGKRSQVLCNFGGVSCPSAVLRVVFPERGGAENWPGCSQVFLKEAVRRCGRRTEESAKITAPVGVNESQLLSRWQTKGPRAFSWVQ